MNASPQQPPPAPRATPRAEARARMVTDLKAAALAQVAAEGAAALSLRAVAREVGVVSSAVYRYFASRDDLLTDLITDSYLALGEWVAAADRPGAPGPERWRGVCDAWRGWALAHPHQFHLVYGSPVPGYAAPASTVAAAARAVEPLVVVVREATEPAAWTPSEAALVESGEAVARQWDLPDAAAAVRLYQALAQLVGLVSLELDGHLVGAFEPADALWRDTVDQVAERLGIGAR